MQLPLLGLYYCRLAPAALSSYRRLAVRLESPTDLGSSKAQGLVFESQKIDICIIVAVQCTGTPVSTVHVLVAGVAGTQVPVVSTPYCTV